MSTRALTPTLVVLAAALAAGCWGGGDAPASGQAAQPLPASVCSRVVYGGPGRPRFLIGMSGWFQGEYRSHGVQTAQAIRLVLEQHGWRAGPYAVGMQACDEVDARTGFSGPAKCTRDARAFAADPSVLGVVGPLTSQCAMAMLAILNAAPGGPVSLINGSNSYVGLIGSGVGAAAGEPDKYYPTGHRNFVRLGPDDQAQGAAHAVMVQRLGLNRVFVVQHDDAYGRGFADAFRLAARRLGLGLVGRASWDERSRTYRPIAARIKAAGAQIVFIAGQSFNGPKLVSDLSAVLGPRVRLMAGAAFNSPGPIVEAAGARAEGFLTSIPVLPNRALPPAGRRFAAAFKHRFGQRPCCFSVHDAQATSMLLDAIAGSGGDRRRVTERLMHSRVHDGFLGDLTVGPDGATTRNTVGMYEIRRGRLAFLTAIDPAPELLRR
jgi:branched-chain amino acid transport system substrate-binding protein